MRNKCTALTALVLGLAVSSQASAVFTDVDMFYSAATSCQGALPSFEGALRKRPLAIVNEGAQTAFVSCGLSTHKSLQSGVGEATLVTIFIRNTGAVAVAVACTLANDQNGSGSQGGSVQIVKSGTIAAATLGAITWVQSENVNGSRFRLPGISCALPPGTQIEQIRTNLTTDVGL